MSRFLVVVPPFAGHVNPMVGVAEELLRRGHTVAWAGEPELLGRLLPDGSAIHPCASPVPPRPPQARGFAALKFLWDDVLVPLAEAMTPGVEQAVAAVRPDALVVDQQAFAGALAAERAGVPWATSATTSSEFTDPLAAMPAVAERVAEQLRALRERLGDPAADGDLRFSPHLVLGFTTPALVGDVRPPGRPPRFVGPVARVEPLDPDFPFAALDSGLPLVLVTLGTMNADAGERFLRECVAALACRPGLTAVVVDPSGALADLPDTVLAVPSAPQQAVLDRAAAVVCHAGHNTVCESLARGLPLVLAPIRDDQPIVAEQVVAAGAGVRLRFAHARAEHIGKALDEVLEVPGYRESARRVRESFLAAGGAVAAADELVILSQNS